MDVEEFRKAGYEAIDSICDYYATLESRPVLAQVKPGYLVEALPREAPEEGENIQEITADFQNLIMPGIARWNHPEFFAYFPCANTFPAILADLYSASVTNPGFNWLCSPACTELEQIVLDWAANLLGLSPAFLNTPPSLPSAASSPCSSPIPGSQPTTLGGGCIQSTASESVLVSLIAARQRFLDSHPTVVSEDLIVYLSTQTHSLGVKGAIILGLNYRLISVDASTRWGVTGKMVKTAYEEDRKQGKWPFAFIGTIGTTSSGANDHIEEIGPIIAELDNVWLHIDAAWAGVSFACPEFRQEGRLYAINAYADSFCTNFHKWGLVNLDCSTLWVRDRVALTSALEVTPSFLRSKQGDEGIVIDYRNWQLALGRRFRSIKIWFVLRNYGVQGFRKHIRKGVKLAQEFEVLVRGSKLFELATPRSLGLVVFRLVPPASEVSEPPSRETLNELNLALHQHITHPTDLADALFITRTELNGDVCLRMAIGAEKTTEMHVRKAMDILERVGKNVLKEAEYTIDGTGEFGRDTSGNGDT